MTNSKNETILMLLSLVFVLSLVPMFMIAQYNYPSLDDFGYSKNTYIMYQSTGSVIKTISVSIDTVLENYYGYHGTYFAW